jgi:hypothetical protein
VEVIGIRKLDLTADVLKVARRNTALYRGGRADVHKNGGLDIAVYGFEGTRAGGAAGFMYCKAHNITYRNIFLFPFWEAFL